MLLLKKFLPLVPAALPVSAARPQNTIGIINVQMVPFVLLVVTLVEIIPIVVGEEALIAMEEITGIPARAAQALVALLVAAEFFAKGLRDDSLKVQYPRVFFLRV